VSNLISKLELFGQPRTVFARLRHRAGASLFESASLMPGLSGWSYIACDPVFTLETRADQTVLLENGVVLESWENPFNALDEVFKRFAPNQRTTTRVATVHGLITEISNLQPETRPEGMNFASGWLGFLGYDLVRFLEDISLSTNDGFRRGAPRVHPLHDASPDLKLHLMDFVLAFDHASSTWYSSQTKLEGIINRECVWTEILELAKHGHAPKNSFKTGKLEAITKPETYLEHVQHCLAYIQAGDIFQVNLTHRLETEFCGDPFALYEALMLENPAPFAAFLSGDDVAVVSASPERFLKRSGRHLEARPIKGTRVRGKTTEEDQAEKCDLEQSQKDRSENLMIVDLMRNDLGRVATFGTVQVSKLFDLEPHGAVWQMVSTITAEMKNNLSGVDVLIATFPPGSMTGAPKIRAMQIIEELEPVPRGIYSGVIGYFDLNGDFDLSVVIRSAIIANKRIQIQAGGAIVADSNPQAELEETYAKTQTLRTVLGQENS
jgi:para-aminobenzoate synthetase component I